VSARSHPSARRQPRAPDRRASLRRGCRTPECSGSGPEAADSLVNPACRLAVRCFGKINPAHSRLPNRKSPPSRGGPIGRLRYHALTHRSNRRQLRFPEGRPGPLPLEQKASQSLPALQAPVSNRIGRCPSRHRPRGLLRSARARGPAGVHRRAFLKRATAFDFPVGTRCRTAVPAIL